jgi:rsbT co-antagonist protein RsbR
MSLLLHASKYITENAESLAVRVVEGVLDKMNLKIPQAEKQQAISMYIDFMKFLGASFIKKNEEIPESIVKWSKSNAMAQVSSGEKISVIVDRYEPTRIVLAELFTQISSEYELSMEDNAFMLARINSILDISLKETVYSFESLSEGLLEKAKRQRAEWSAPIVPIKEGIAVLPFVGEYDIYRATYILEKIVPKMSDLQIEYLIADFSGIFSIDHEIAHFLNQIRKTLNLLGIEVVVSGLRPELAQVVVQSGIDMSSVKTYAQVQQALEYLLKN